MTTSIAPLTKRAAWKALEAPNTLIPRYRKLKETAS
jgi:hypothetical protein